MMFMNSLDDGIPNSNQNTTLNYIVDHITIIPSHRLTCYLWKDNAISICNNHIRNNKSNVNMRQIKVNNIKLI